MRFVPWAMMVADPDLTETEGLGRIGHLGSIGILGSIGSTIGNIAGNIKCGAEDVAADVRLQDEAFMQRQLDCVLDKGPCDELGANIKRKLKRS